MILSLSAAINIDLYNIACALRRSVNFPIGVFPHPEHTTFEAFDLTLLSHHVYNVRVLVVLPSVVRFLKKQTNKQKVLEICPSYYPAMPLLGTHPKNPRQYTIEMPIHLYLTHHHLQ